MARELLCSQFPEYPPDLIQAVAREAERDADRVGLFLTTAALTPPIHLRAEFLLNLGAALRLLQWEQAGIDLHARAGLPSGKQALLDVLAVAAGQAAPDVVEYVRRLPLRVTALFVEEFAWTGRLELGADVTLDPADADALLEGLADFLWACRPR